LADVEAAAEAEAEDEALAAATAAGESTLAPGKWHGHAGFGM